VRGAGLVLAVAGVVVPAHALPTMIRLGYANCAACHVAPQGGGLLNAYGRGIDEAQSLRAGEYAPTENPVVRALSWGGRITQDIRIASQEQVSTSSGAPVRGILRSRFFYRNATELGKGWRFSAVVAGENESAARPNLGYDGAVRPTTVYVPQALVSYRPKENLEFSAGRDQLPNGVNLPDLGMYIRARNDLGYYDAPTQVKAFWWGKRYHVNPYAYAPGGTERSGFHESGGGGLAEFDLLGKGRTVAGINALRGTSYRVGRTLIGPYARLGFGRWGVFAEHDVTARTLRHSAAPVSFRQDATLGQVFYAVREWLVASGGYERLTVEKPYQERLTSGTFQLTSRLSSQFTVAVAARVQRNHLNGKTGPSVAVQFSMKSPN
jgi:hypothetical protein